MSTLGAWFCCETLEMHEETYTMRIYRSKTYIIVNNTQNPKPNVSTTIFFSIWQWKPPVAQVGLSLKNSNAWYCRTYLYFRIQISSLDIGRSSKNKSWFPINKNDLPDFENGVVIVMKYDVCCWKRSKSSENKHAVRLVVETINCTRVKSCRCDLLMIWNPVPAKLWT